MKKNVFSRTIAVLASMTVLGAASMLSASAKGLQVETVEVEQGTTKVDVPVTLVDAPNSKGFSATFKADSPAILSITPSGVLVSDGDPASGVFAVSASGNGYAGGVATTLTVELAADAEPGSYPITVELSEFDDDGAVDPADFTAVAGGIEILEPATEPTTEEPTTAAPTTAAPTTAAPTTTTAKKSASPKTGTTGVAVAVAGLVTAGATAVVLKKRH